MDNKLSEGEIKDAYSELADKLSRLPTEKLAKKIDELTTKLRKAVADFDERMKIFFDHKENLVKVVGDRSRTPRTVGLSEQMRMLFAQGKTDEFEQKKKELSKIVNLLLYDSVILTKTISVIRTDEDVIIRLERWMYADLSELQKRSTKIYASLEKDSKRFIELARSKISGNMNDSELDKETGIVGKELEEKKAAIQEEAHLIAIIRELVKIIARFDPIIASLKDLVGREQTHLKTLIVPAGMRPESDKIEQAEIYLQRLAEEILEQLREEKLRVHDPFMELIGQERTGIHKLQEILKSKKSLWRIGKGDKITLKDIERAIHYFTSEEERHAFLSAIMGLVVDESRSIDPEVSEKSLMKIYKESENEIKRTYRRAITDKLTQLNNRDFFDQKLVSSVKKKIPLCLLMLDIDHFKRFNDTFGHQIGDKVLMEVAGILSDEVREEDIVGRYGGEEMVIILLNTPLDAAYGKVAERLRTEVEAHPLLNEDGKNLQWPETGENVRITISGGLVHVGRQDYVKEEWDVDTPESWASFMSFVGSIVETADYMLYAAKEEGRNRIIAGEYAEKRIQMQNDEKWQNSKKK